MHPAAETQAPREYAHQRVAVHATLVVRNPQQALEYFLMFSVERFRHLASVQNQVDGQHRTSAQAANRPGTV